MTPFSAGNLIRKAITRDGIAVSVSDYTTGDNAVKHLQYPVIAPVFHLESTGSTLHKVLLTKHYNESSGYYDGRHLVISWYADLYNPSQNQLKHMMSKLKDHTTYLAETICADVFDESDYINQMLQEKISEVNFETISDEFIW